MDKLNTPMGEAITKTTLLGGAFVGLAGMLKAGGLIDIIKNFGTFADLISTGGKFSKQTVLGDVRADILGIHKSLHGLPLVIGAIASAIAGANALVDHLTLSYEESVEKVNKLKQANEELFGEGTRYQEIIEQRKLAYKDEGLSEELQHELDLLERQKKVQQDLLRMAEQESFDAWRREQSQPKGLGKYFDSDYASMHTPSAWLTGELMGTGLPWDKGLFEPFKEGKKDIQDFSESLLESIGASSEYNNHLQEMKDSGLELNEQEETSLSTHKKLQEIYASSIPEIEKFGASYYEALIATGRGAEEAEHIVNTAMDTIEAKQIENIERQEEAVEQSTEQVTAKPHEIPFTPNYEKVEASEPPSLPGLVKYTADFSGLPVIAPGIGGVGANAIGTDNSPGGPTLVNELGPELISANGTAWIAGGGEPTITNLPKGAIVLTAGETKRALLNGGIPAHSDGAHRNISAIMNDFASSSVAKVPGDRFYWNPLDRFLLENKGEQDAKKPGPHKPTKSSGGSAAPSGPSEEDLKEQTKQFKEQVKLMEHKLFLMEKEGKSDEERIGQMQAIQAEIEKQKQWYRDQGLDDNSKYIQDLEKQWWKYADEIKKVYEDQAGVYDMLFSAVGEKAQDEIDVLNKQKQEIQEQNSELQKQVELEKALDELARAKQQKKLVLRDGQMVYATDVDAVNKAQQRVDEIKNREDADKRIEAIDKQIQAWEEYKEQWDSVVSDYDKKQDLMLLKEKLGVDLEAENWQDRLDNIQTYLDKYNELMVKAGYKDIKGATKPIVGSSTPIPISSAPSNSTKGLGVPMPSDLMNAVNTGKISAQKAVAITIQNFAPDLSSIKNGEEFVNYLRSNFVQQTLQFANG